MENMSTSQSVRLTPKCESGARLTVSPPRSGSPKEVPSPDVAVLGDILELILQRLDAGGVRRAGRLPEDGLLTVLLKPGRREGETLAADGAAYARLVGP